jgi:hypothetical protein
MCVQRMKPYTVSEVLPIIREYYNKPGNGNGGSLHIVLEDDNVADKHIKWCITHAVEVGDSGGEYLGRILLTMSKTQRLKLGKLIGEYL